jgi:hypothetical protein
LHQRLGLSFQWVADRSALQTVSADQLNYRFRDFDYAIRVANGAVTKAADGVHIVAGQRGGLRLLMAQTK